MLLSFDVWAREVSESVWALTAVGTRIISESVWALLARLCGHWLLSSHAKSPNQCGHCWHSCLGIVTPSGEDKRWIEKARRTRAGRPKVLAVRGYTGELQAEATPAALPAGRRWRVEFTSGGYFLLIKLVSSKHEPVSAAKRCCSCPKAYLSHGGARMIIEKHAVIPKLK